MSRSTNGSVTSHSEGDEQQELTKAEQAIEREKITGFVFPLALHEGKTPKDFARNPDTGRSGHSAVFGIYKADLRTGIQGVTIPCQFIWKRGRWLEEFDAMDCPLWNVKPKEIVGHKEPQSGWEWAIWIVSGEGAPSDWAFLAYLIPTEIAKNPTDTYNKAPRHPLLWRKALKEGVAGQFEAVVDEDWKSAPPISREKEWYQASWELLIKGELPVGKLRRYTYGHGYPQTHTPAPAAKAAPTTPTVPKTQAPALPAAARFRHVCGHWFKEGELAGHAKVCGVTQEGEESDFAILCDDKCGCELLSGFPTELHALGHKTLDHVARPKPGFPRPKKEVVVTATDATVAAGDDTGSDAAPPEATEAETTEVQAPEPATA